jgi:ABC-2 type transport system ATP-binding protein
MIALEARGLMKAYTSVPAVSDVSFSLNSGEVLGCLGPNGSGKSTTVRMLTGLLEPTRGEVLCGGKSIQSNLVRLPRTAGLRP